MLYKKDHSMFSPHGSSKKLIVQFHSIPQVKVYDTEV